MRLMGGIKLIEQSVFDSWAEEYDLDVVESDLKNEYPFAGYQKLMRLLYEKIIEKAPVQILDVGIGTGTLASKLYESGIAVTGIDFSDEMLQIAENKMPNAKLIKWDLSKGMPPEIGGKKFDIIISTYALHHFTDPEKLRLIPLILTHLEKDGVFIIGDIGFETLADLEVCKDKFADIWDYDEFFFVMSELRQGLSCHIRHELLSHCCVLIELRL